MTRKDYELIARTLRAQWGRIPAGFAVDGKMHGENDMLRSTIDDMTHALASDNPRFDRERFLKACGVQS